MNDVVMNYIFWICWTAEFLAACWWIYTELKLVYIRTNPLAFLSIFYLAFAVILRTGFGIIGFTNMMILIPAIPLAGLGLIIVIYASSRRRPN